MVPVSRAWIRLPPGSAAKSVLTTAVERGFTTFLADEADAAALAGLAKVRLLTVRDGEVREGERALGPRVEIASVEDQSRALALAGRRSLVLVSARDWRVIPYENLIAAYQGKGTTLVAEATGVADALLLLETLEVGVDAAVLDARAPADVLALAEALASRAARAVPLSRASVLAVRHVASGDRVCVDTASLFAPGEGILVGSSSNAMFLVHSEAIESGYVAARPFRVNAGPVHAYVMLPDGRTKYLSEVRAGDEVLAVSADGRARSVVVGRAKVETRPLLLVEAESGGKRFSTLLQNAETIRLVTPGGGAISVVELKEGDEVLVRLDDVGRHFGTAVRETIRER